MRMIQTNATVDGRNPAPVDMVNNIPLFKGFSGLHVKWCRISSINSTTNNHIGWIPPKLYESKLRISLQLLTPNVFCGVPLFCITLNIYNYNACWSQWPVILLTQRPRRFFWKFFVNPLGQTNLAHPAAGCLQLWSTKTSHKFFECHDFVRLNTPHKTRKCLHKF